MPKNFLILLFFLNALCAKLQAQQEFFLDDWQAKTIESPEYINTPEPSGQATITISINFTDTITKVSKYIFGNNAVNWAGKMQNNTALVQRINDLKPHVLRWPGGNLSNEHFWNAVQNAGPSDIPPGMQINPLNAGMNTTNWAMTVDDYYSLQAKTNSTGSICINYSYARYGTSENPVAKAAHYAAEWVRYDKGRTKFWEIGNENGGPWQAGYEIDTSLNKDNQPKTISGGLYGRHSKVFIDSMRAAAAEIGAEIKIGVVVEGSHARWNSVMENWNKTMLPENGEIADFLVVHSYFTPYNENSGIQTILNSPPQVLDYKNYILTDVKKYTNKENIPLALTEWNIFAVGSKQAVSYINGMHAALIYGELIKNKYGMSMRWDLMNGWDNGNDHGLFARDGEPGMSYGIPHAPFYYMYFFQKYFGDVMVNAQVTGDNSVVAYASSFSSGQSGIVLINKSNAKRIVSLNIENMPQAKSYFRYVLTGGTDNGDFSRQVFVNGFGPETAGGGPSNYKTIKALGKSITGNIKIELPPLSVTYTLVSDDLVPPLTAIQNTDAVQFNVFPNPASGQFTITSNNSNPLIIEIYNLNGKKVFQQNWPNNAYSTTVNASLNPGMYMISLVGKNKQQIKKLIIY